MTRNGDGGGGALGAASFQDGRRFTADARAKREKREPMGKEAER